MISGDVAKMPLEVFRRLPDKGDRAKEVDRTHPAFRACCRMANEKDPSFKVWARAMVHALIWNSGFIWVRGYGTNRIRLYNLLPDRTWFDPKPSSASDVGLYYSEVNDKLVALYPSEVLHIEGLSMGDDDAYELELIKQARDSWGVGLSMMDFKSKFYKNYGHAGGYLEIPAHFTEKAAGLLEEGFRKRQSSGPDNWFKTVILRDGAKFHQATIDPEKQQLSEATEDMAIEVARWFNLQPSRLGVRSAVSYGSKSEDNQSYFDQTLSHWTCAIQSECYAKLLTTAEQDADSHLFRHDIRALVAANPKTQAEIDAINIAAGITNRNEARSNQGMNPVKGGELFIIPMNHYIVDADGNVKTPAILETEHENPTDAEPEDDSAPTEPSETAPSETAPAAEMASKVMFSMTGAALDKAKQRIRTETSRKTPDNLLEWWDRTRETMEANVLREIDPGIDIFQTVTGQDCRPAVTANVGALFESVERCFNQASDGEIKTAIQTALGNHEVKIKDESNE
jgi:HK97 family phage portal protein